MEVDEGAQPLLQRRAAWPAPRSVVPSAGHPRRPAPPRLLLRAVGAVAPNGAACPGTSLNLPTTADLRKVVFEEANPVGPTVQSQFRACSYGHAQLTPQNSMVAERVNLPCNGTM